MATPLRYALIFLLWAMVAVIYAPLIPAALTLISPALSLTHWQALFADPQLPQALLATLVSTTIATVGALLIALLVIVALWPGPKWQRMCARRRGFSPFPMWLLPPAPCCSLLTEGCFMTISRISLRQWTDLASVWAS
ncbi:ABC transporter, permease protein, partial [Escherichia coli ECC-1470]